MTHFSRYHKYTHGTALRSLTREILTLIVRATHCQVLNVVSQLQVAEVIRYVPMTLKLFLQRIPQSQDGFVAVAGQHEIPPP